MVFVLCAAPASACRPKLDRVSLLRLDISNMPKIPRWKTNSAIRRHARLQSRSRQRAPRGNIAGVARRTRKGGQANTNIRLEFSQHPDGWHRRFVGLT